MLSLLEFHSIKKGIVYVLSTGKIIYLYDVVFDENISIALAYTSQPYSDAMDMRPSVTYTFCMRL